MTSRTYSCTFCNAPAIFWNKRRKINQTFRSLKGVAILFLSEDFFATFLFLCLKMPKPRLSYCCVSKCRSGGKHRFSQDPQLRQTLRRRSNGPRFSATQKAWCVFPLPGGRLRHYVAWHVNVNVTVVRESCVCCGQPTATDLMFRKLGESLPR
jgi:hypothetical protein